MRVVVNCSGLFVIMTIIILIHTSIINKNVRDMEINYSLASAMDYALDVMKSEYSSMEYDKGNEQQCVDKLLHSFCVNFERVIGTDGDIEVFIISADVEQGFFEIVVEETYTYSFRGRKGKAVCERAVILG